MMGYLMPLYDAHDVKWSIDLKKIIIFRALNASWICIDEPRLSVFNKFMHSCSQAIWIVQLRLNG